MFIQLGSLVVFILTVSENNLIKGSVNTYNDKESISLPVIASSFWARVLRFWRTTLCKAQPFAGNWNQIIESLIRDGLCLQMDECWLMSWINIGDSVMAVNFQWLLSLPSHAYATKFIRLWLVPWSLPL